ncbi:MAG TPA: nucleoside hydrolase [Nitrospiraceae bacterium]|nr:nucleoside hydrolase [Nitrospiraceae bacterium]
MGPSSPTRVVIDTDPGLDDALALLLAFRSAELEVTGITTVCGNVPVGQATKNLFRVLTLLQPFPSVPVGQGAARPLEYQLATATQFHGADGLGDLDQFLDATGACRYASPRLPASLPTAQEVWQECGRRYSGELVLITLGPLTNVALALKVSPGTVQRFTRIIAMAGAIAVPGNVTPAAEFNVFVDPHAARRVVQAGLPLTLIPLDVTTQVGFDRQRVASLTKDSCDGVARFIADSMGTGFDFAESVEGHGRVHLHDPLAIAAAIDDSVFTLEPLHVEVEAAGDAARGMTIADRRALLPEYRIKPNVQVALGVDVSRVITLFEDRLCRK